MSQSFEQLADLQRLVGDMAQVDRHHRVAGTERAENVVEHSMAVAMLCWHIHESLGLGLSLPKIFKYALVHDLPERGQDRDTATYATEPERQAKIVREQGELARLVDQFGDFRDFTYSLRSYDTLADDEALFVWTVDKLQAVVHGEMDGWHAYAEYGVSYEAFCDKSDEQLAVCYVPLRELFAEVIDHAKRTYYDQPDS